jgi:fluoride exporter
VTQHRKLETGVDQAAVPPAAKPPPPRHTLELYAAVVFGSVIGSVLRALVSLAFMAGFGTAIVWPTLFVNVTGSFLIGFYAALTGPDGRLFAGPRQRHFVMTGVCGGYTTFSMFSLETLQLWQNGLVVSAGLTVAVSIITWLGAVWLGYGLATRLNRLKGA